MARFARTTLKSVPIVNDFGMKYATYLFGAEAIASLPRYTRGPKAGQPKGFINWIRTIEPGYHPNAGTGVKEGTTVRAWITEHQGAPESSALRGTWNERTQNLCGSMSVLGDRGRVAYAQDKFARAQHLDEIKREVEAQQKAAADAAERAVARAVTATTKPEGAI